MLAKTLEYLYLSQGQGAVRYCWDASSGHGRAFDRGTRSESCIEQNRRPNRQPPDPSSIERANNGWDRPSCDMVRMAPTARYGLGVVESGMLGAPHACLSVYP
jgi:hypothetical protein